LKIYKVLDLFSGVGGLSYGFANDNNFQIVAGNEILEDMAKAYSLNHPNIKLYNCDIKDFGIKNLTNDLDIKKGDIDIIIGGPPCQAFSSVGKRLKDDPRANLFREYYRVLKEVSPNIFLFENVRGLLSIRDGELFKEIVELFESLNYHITYKILNSADYGVPQIRKRVIIIGTKSDKKFIYPPMTHSNTDKNLKPYLTLSDAIGDLPFIGNNQESFKYAKRVQNEFQNLMRQDTKSKLIEHNSPNNNTKIIKIMKSLKDGGTPRELPKNIRPNSGFSNNYCKLWWEKPALTITRNLGTPSSSRCIHPKAHRPLTTREGARLQSFPDNYKFYGSRSAKNLQIGNAVPILLSIALKDSIKNYMDNY